MKKVALHSFGCRTNQEEMTAFAASFKSMGYEVLDTLDDADVIVVNSCSVTAVAENKNRRFIQSLSKKYPKAEICVTGCLAQQKPTELAQLDQVKWVVGNADKGQAPSLIAAGTGGVFTHSVTVKSDIPLPDALEAPEQASKTRFSLKIQEGCDHYCTFCIVPYLRGPSRSVSFEEVIATAQKAIDLGYREIVLTGTHIGQFKSSGHNFVDIITTVLSLDDTIRIRMSSMNPADLTDELFDVMKTNERLCPQVHISAQSLSPAILKLMKRSSRAMMLLKERIIQLKKDLPEVNIGGDFIVGFPGETEELFAETLEGLSQWGFTYGHVFKYSPRPGTKAAEVEDQVSGDDKNSRSALVRAQILELQKEYYQSLVGTQEKIIIEQEGYLKGITGNYIKVSGDQSAGLAKNRLVPITISGYDSAHHTLSITAHL